MRIVFFGTPEFAARTLEYLLANGIEVAAVVTQPPRPKGRSGKPIPSPVAEVARHHSIDLLEPEKASADEVCDQLATYNADLFVVVAYGEIVRKRLRKLPRQAIINVHPSLLPKYRGAAPIQRAIMNGESETGVTIMHLIKELDAGAMLRQEKLPIDPDATFDEVESELCDLGCHLLLATIHDFEKGTPPVTPQDESQVTHAPKIETADRHLDFSRPALELHNLIRAVTGWCDIKLGEKNLRLKVLKSKIGNAPDGLVVPCGTGHLQLLEVQLEGKKAMPAGQLLRGLQQKIEFVR
jgi:methionyl-tRNA formyltransferase